jgi:hypothetical protein
MAAAARLFRYSTNDRKCRAVQRTVPYPSCTVWLAVPRPLFFAQRALVDGQPPRFPDRQLWQLWFSWSSMTTGLPSSLPNLLLESQPFPSLGFPFPTAYSRGVLDQLSAGRALSVSRSTRAHSRVEARTPLQLPTGRSDPARHSVIEAEARQSSLLLYQVRMGADAPWRRKPLPTHAGRFAWPWQTASS